MVRYLFYTIGDLTYQSPLVVLFQPVLFNFVDILFACKNANTPRSTNIHCIDDLSKCSINSNVSEN